MIFYIALVLFALLLVLFQQDARSTIGALRMGGTEAGKISAALVKRFGMVAGIYMSKVLGVAVGAFMLWLAYRGEAMALPGMAAAGVFYFKTVRANWQWIRKWRPTVKAWRGKQ